MKPPLQALLIAPDEEMREKILRGEKQITIREGHRDYRLGNCLLACPDEPWCVEVNVTNVRHCLIGKISKEEYRADGYESQGRMLRDLRRFYPNIELQTPATVIQWENVRGKLVENYKCNQNVKEVFDEVKKKLNESKFMKIT